jgi:hypothetical protein
VYSIIFAVLALVISKNIGFAILGFVIGSLFDGYNRVNSKKEQNGNQSNGQRQSVFDLFEYSKNE